MAQESPEAISVASQLDCENVETAHVDLCSIGHHPDSSPGKVTVDASGNVVAKGEITAKKINIDERDPATTSVGNGTIATGSTSVIITTKAVRTKSRIFVTPRGKTGDHQLAFGTVKDSASFTVPIEHSYTGDISFDWLIVN